MIKNIHKSHDKFFKTISLLTILIVIGIIITLTYYVINATSSTTTQAAGQNCGKYYGKKDKCFANGCVYSTKNKTCNFPSVNVNNSKKGKSPVKTKAGYCLGGLDCNVGWEINDKFYPPEPPKGSYECPQPYKGNLRVYCCPPGMHRDDVTKGPGKPGTCVK